MKWNRGVPNSWELSEIERWRTANDVVAEAIRRIGPTPQYSALHRRRFVETILLLSELIPSERSVVLDVGVWPGYLSLALVLSGYRVLGWDLDPSRLAPVVLESVPAMVVNLNDPALTLPPLGSVDAVVLAEIIEHLEPLRATQLFRFLENYLSPRGIVLVTTPNRRRLGSVLTRSAPSGTDAQGHGHTHEYTLAELRQVITDAGLAIERSDYQSFYDDVGTTTEGWFEPLGAWVRHPAKVRNAIKMTVRPLPRTIPPLRDSLIVVARPVSPNYK